MRFAAISDLHFGRAAPYRGVDRKLTGHAPALAAAFVEILESHEVAMAMNGHVHWNNQTVHNGISYITIQSLVENAAGDGQPAGAWALVEAGATQLEVTVGGRDPARYRVRGRDL